jgi:hypothetical protein
MDKRTEGGDLMTTNHQGNGDRPAMTLVTDAAESRDDRPVRITFSCEAVFGGAMAVMVAVALWADLGPRVRWVPDFRVGIVATDPDNGAKARLGGIYLNHADVSGTLTANTSVNNVVAIGIGKDAVATVGGISVEGRFSGNATSNTIANNTVAIGIGRLSKAQIGGINIR